MCGNELTISTALGVIGTAVAASAAATASTTAVSTSMNAEGDIFKQVKDISKDTWDATTSRSAFENYAIAAGTAGLTAGISNAEIVRNIDTATTTGKITKALADSAISSTASTVAQSAINGESFSDAIKNQGTNILIGAVTGLGAQQIGTAYHTGQIGKATQLIAHAGLGAATAELTGNDALSGAVSGVVGEVGGEFIDKNTNLSNNAIKELAGLAGGYSAIFTGNLVGNSDGEVAGNIFSGQRIGKNAAENNLLHTEIVEHNKNKTVFNNFGPRWEDPETRKYHREYKDGYIKENPIIKVLISLLQKEKKYIQLLKELFGEIINLVAMEIQL